MNKKIFLILVITLMWVSFIFYNSSNNGVISNKRSGYIVGILKKSYVEVKNSSVHCFNLDKIIVSNRILTKKLLYKKIHVIIRKNAHFFEYLVLAVLVKICFKYLTNQTYIVNILFICLMCAVLDEFYQSFIIGRTSSVGDVLIDFSGSLTGMIICLFFETRKTWSIKRDKNIRH